jgi:hypothetical protein
MCGAAYDALLERVGGALDYEVRWRPTEDEPEGFVERIQPLQLTDGTHTQASCPACGVRVLATAPRSAARAARSSACASCQKECWIAGLLLTATTRTQSP